MLFASCLSLDGRFFCHQAISTPGNANAELSTYVGRGYWYWRFHRSRWLVQEDAAAGLRRPWAPQLRQLL